MTRDSYTIEDIQNAEDASNEYKRAAAIASMEQDEEDEAAYLVDTKLLDSWENSYMASGIKDCV